MNVPFSEEREEGRKKNTPSLPGERGRETRKDVATRLSRGTHSGLWPVDESCYISTRPARGQKGGEENGRGTITSPASVDRNDNSGGLWERRGGGGVKGKKKKDGDGESRLCGVSA